MKLNQKQSSADVLRNIWKEAPRSKREELLEARGLNKTWAEAETIEEMVHRGGGMVATDLHGVVKEWQRKNPGINVRFKR